MVGGRVCVYKALGSRGVIFLKQRPPRESFTNWHARSEWCSKNQLAGTGDTERPGETVGEHLK